MFNTTMYGEITEAIDKLKDSAEEYLISIFIISNA